MFAAVGRRHTLNESQQWRLQLETTTTGYCSALVSNGNNTSIMPGLSMNSLLSRFMPSLLLRRLLSFPTWDQRIPNIVNDDCLDMQGQATWKIEKPENCDLGIIVRRLIVGVPRPTHRTIQASRVRDTHFVEAPHKPENHIGILVLA